MTGEMANIPGDRLPSDHPQPHTGPVDSPSIWYGPEMMGDDTWIEGLKPIYGRGFVLLRGVSIERLLLEETAALYWGIGSYIGNLRPQNARGQLLGYVPDIEGEVVEKARWYLKNRHLPYHCDYADIVTLLCLRKARAGGLSSLVSSHTIHNEIWAKRPDLAEVLYGPAPRDRHDGKRAMVRFAGVQPL